MLPIINNEELIADLVRWIQREDRTYADVMEAWRTSCPRLAIWEDATDHGLIERAWDEHGTAIVRITSRGKAYLEARAS